jgi:hypothetical protein
MKKFPAKLAAIITGGLGFAFISSVSEAADAPWN